MVEMLCTRFQLSPVPISQPGKITAVKDVSRRHDAYKKSDEKMFLPWKGVLSLPMNWYSFTSSVFHHSSQCFV